MHISYEYILSTATGVFLIPCAVSDIRRKEISFRFLSAAVGIALAAEIYLIFLGESVVGDLFLSLMPGVFLLLIGAVTGGKVGMGDGIVFLTIGLTIGCSSAFTVMFLSLIFSAVWSGYLMLSRKAGRNTAIPWMPFVLAGYLIWFLFSVIFPLS